MYIFFLSSWRGCSPSLAFPRKMCEIVVDDFLR